VRLVEHVVKAADPEHLPHRHLRVDPRVVHRAPFGKWAKSGIRPIRSF
jgi:hypothetical protein